LQRVITIRGIGADRRVEPGMIRVSSYRRSRRFLVGHNPPFLTDRAIPPYSLSEGPTDNGLETCLVYIHSEPPTSFHP